MALIDLYAKLIINSRAKLFLNYNFLNFNYFTPNKKKKLMNIITDVLSRLTEII